MSAPFPGPKKNNVFEKVAQKNLLDNNGLLAPKAPYLEADFAEGEIVPQQCSRPRASGAPAPRVLSSYTRSIRL